MASNRNKRASKAQQSAPEPAPVVQAPTPETPAAEPEAQPATPEFDAASIATMAQAVQALAGSIAQATGQADPEPEVAGPPAPVRMHGGFALNTLPKHIAAIATRKGGDVIAVPKDLTGVTFVAGKPIKSRSAHGSAWAHKAVEMAKHGVTTEQLIAAGVPLHNIAYMVRRTGYLAVQKVPVVDDGTVADVPTSNVLSAAGANVGLENMIQQATDEEGVAEEQAAE